MSSRKTVCLTALYTDASYRTDVKFHYTLSKESTKRMNINNLPSLTQQYTQYMLFQKKHESKYTYGQGIVSFSL